MIKDACAVCGREMNRKKLFIGYACSDCIRTVDINYVIRDADTTEEKKQIEKLCSDTYGELDFVERGKWYDLRKMSSIVALKGNDVVGCASWTREKEELFLLMILVKPDYQRRGIATALLNKIKEIAGDLKLGTVFVPISNDDLVSYVFYHKNGFCISGVDIGLPEKRHEGEESGFWGLPCRDEFYLEYKLTGFFSRTV